MSWQTDQILGRNGFQHIDDTVGHLGAWSALQVVTDASFSALDGNATNATGKIFPAGMILYGRFRGMVLASGSLNAYHA